ncbi:MAG: Sir2 family NAD-dependent protein deacetylase [Chloroflexi bacterium]|nr:Sir2 family NAD-dependent protein deacetylase [Chloroflexota bacterium]
MAEFPEELAAKLVQASNIVLGCHYVVAIVGAGLSVESGIPPYRGPGGLWTKYGEPPMLSYREFVGDPKLWWEERLQGEVEPGNPIYEMKLAVDQAEPNPGHYALVELERLGVLQQTITQNVDNLHRRAGSQHLIEIHGNRTWLRCMDCGARRPRDGFSLVDLPPRCPQCEGIIKSDTVMFGEPIPTGVLQECWRQVELCDCVLLVGTSGTVNPAAQLPLLAKKRGATLIEVNPHETSLSSQCDLTLEGPSGEIMPALVNLVRQRLPAD